jgi:aminopeptidase
VNGKVYATRPMSYQGKLINDFWIEFKDGKVIDYDAKQNRDVLENIINTDEGAKHLGEVALINFDSPVFNLDIVFLNTMFDENSSCHMSLGRATSLSIKGGSEMKLEELQAKGYNHSAVQADFMFGSPDLSIIGITKKDEKIEIFNNGNFII